MLIIQVFGPANEGAGAIEALIDTLEGLYNSAKVTISGNDRIEFGVPVAVDVGNAPGDKAHRFQINLTIPWEHLDI